MSRSVVVVVVVVAILLNIRIPRKILRRQGNDTAHLQAFSNTIGTKYIVYNGLNCKQRKQQQTNKQTNKQTSNDWHEGLVTTCKWAQKGLVRLVTHKDVQDLGNDIVALYSVLKQYVCLFSNW